MSVFTEILRQRRLSRINQRMESTPPERKTGFLESLGKLINSPIVITLISGLFVAGVTNSWQENSARHESMQKTMILFADQFAKILNLLPTMKDRELAVRTLREQRKRAQSAPAVSAPPDSAFGLAEKRLDETLIRLNALSDSNALTSQARATFRSMDVARYCDELDIIVDEIGKTADLGTALRAHARALELYRLIVREMGLEMRE